MSGKPTVIYVMSDVRSGSTLLENILSKSEELVSVGEMALLKNHILHKGPGAKWNWNCSCGSPILLCQFWHKALHNIAYDSEHFSTAVQWNYRSKKLYAGSLFSPLITSHLRRLNQRKINQATIRNNIDIYRNIFAVTGKQFIVDSSKDPVQAYLTYVNKPDDFDVKIICLTRDLRAIAASKKKWGKVNQKQPKSLRKLLTNSLFYKKICVGVTRLVREPDVITLSYEDLAKHTQQQLDTIVSKCGLQPYEAPQFMGVENDHTIAGTPQRFTKRPIAYDNSWKSAYRNKPVLSFLGTLFNHL